LIEQRVMKMKMNTWGVWRS